MQDRYVTDDARQETEKTGTPSARSIVCVQSEMRNGNGLGYDGVVAWDLVAQLNSCRMSAAVVVSVACLGSTSRLNHRYESVQKQPPKKGRKQTFDGRGPQGHRDAVNCQRHLGGTAEPRV
jgi:hypothetical protein